MGGERRLQRLGLDPQAAEVARGRVVAGRERRLGDRVERDRVRALDSAGVERLGEERSVLDLVRVGHPRREPTGVDADPGPGRVNRRRRLPDHGREGRRIRRRAPELLAVGLEPDLDRQQLRVAKRDLRRRGGVGVELRSGDRVRGILDARRRRGPARRVAEREHRPQARGERLAVDAVEVRPLPVLGRRIRGWLQRLPGDPLADHVRAAGDGVVAEAGRGAEVLEVAEQEIVGHREQRRLDLLQVLAALALRVLGPRVDLRRAVAPQEHPAGQLAVGVPGAERSRRTGCPCGAPCSWSP